MMPPRPGALGPGARGVGRAPSYTRWSGHTGASCADCHRVGSVARDAGLVEIAPTTASPDDGEAMKETFRIRSRIAQAGVLAVAIGLRLWGLRQNGFDNEYYA